MVCHLSKIATKVVVRDVYYASGWPCKGKTCCKLVYVRQLIRKKTNKNKDLCIWKGENTYPLKTSSCTQRTYPSRLLLLCQSFSFEVIIYNL
jgi:hypothetical protein